MWETNLQTIVKDFCIQFIIVVHFPIRMLSSKITEVTFSFPFLLCLLWNYTIHWQHRLNDHNLNFIPRFSKILFFFFLHVTHFTALHFYRYCIFYKLKICGNPELSKFLGTISKKWTCTSNSVCSLWVSVSHLGESHNIINFLCSHYICDADHCDL